MVRSSLAGWPSLVQQAQRQSCGLILGVELQDGLKAEALFGEIVRFRCQPEPGGNFGGTGTAEVLHYELGQESSELVNHEQVVEGSAGFER